MGSKSSQERRQSSSNSFKENDESVVEASRVNLSQDDLSQINELSSIESLIAAMPAEIRPQTGGPNSFSRNPFSAYFAKVYRKIKFYFKTVDLILFNKPSLRHDGQVSCLEFLTDENN